MSAPAKPPTVPGTARRAGPWRWLNLEVIGVVFVFGVFAYLLWPLAQAPSVYPDSGTVLSISRTLANGDPQPVWSTQSPPLQDALYAGILVLEWPVIHYPTVLASFGLAILLGFFAYRFTGERLASITPPLVLMFSHAFWYQAGYLSLYAGFVLLGYAGLYLCLYYLLRGGSLWRVLAGTTLVAAALYTFTTALVFLVVPLLALMFFYSGARARRLLVLYTVLGASVAPWVVWHLRVGGLRHFFYHPLNWFTVKYLGVLNAEFWDYERASLPDYAKTMSSVAVHDLLPPVLLLFVVPGLWYVWRTLGPRAVLFCIACLAAYGSLLLVTRPAPYARYFFPVLPLVILLASAGLWTGLGGIGSALGRPVLAAFAVAAAALPLLGELPPAVATSHFRFVERLDSSPGYKDLLAMADHISQTDGGIVARDSAIQQVVPNNQVFTHFLLSEDDYVMYLSWPDDAAVAEMFQRRKIEWALVYNDLKWERDYNVWLEAAYGVEPRHYQRIADSPYFERVYAGRAYQLYHLDPDGIRDVAAGPR